MIKIKRNNFFTATIVIMASFILVLATAQPSKAQSNENYLYSGCGYILSEALYENTSDTSINLYSGYGYSLSELLY